MTEQVICVSAVLEEHGKGARFNVEIDDRILPAFAIRYEGKVYAFVNRCAHQGVELDWSTGNFFDLDGDFLICATHGARYHPETGACAGGPCTGSELVPLGVLEQEEKVCLVAEGARLVKGKHEHR